MKQASWIWIVPALLVGLALGSWSLRGDLRRARQELELARSQLRKGNSRTGGIEGITTMLRIPDRARPSEEDRQPSPPREAADPDTAEAASAVIPAPTNVAAGTASNTNHVPMRDRIQAAAELWRTRGALARTSFLTNVDPDEQQAAKFDVLMAAMNLRMSNSVREWVEVLKTERRVTPEMGVRVMHELSEIMVLTYDEMDRSLPDDWRARAGEGFQLLDFVNPDVAMPLVEVEPMLQGQGSQPFGHGPHRHGGE